jgi:decaprenylphospho-beta-D-ribofuranose 2-oxidase
MTKLTLNGWGRTTPGISDVDSPKLNELDNIFHTNTTILPRGLGRTYGDAAQNSGGRTILLDQIRKSHLELGVLEVEAGESIGNLTKLYLGKGWFIPVTPGTKFVTIGGAIASDVHGKNHHCAGSFGDYIVSLDISTPIGDFT